MGWLLIAFTHDTRSWGHSCRVASCGHGGPECALPHIQADEVSLVISQVERSSAKHWHGPADPREYSARLGDTGVGGWCCFGYVKVAALVEVY